jgi:Family of unknown function (DUF1028)
MACIVTIYPMKTSLTSLMCLCFVLVLQAQRPYSKEPLAHTYSIVAIDPVTGDMGVAVQSHWFATGTIVIWGEAGVGVVATQSLGFDERREKSTGSLAAIDRRR